MAKAILVGDREFERDYKISNGKIITIVLEEDLSEMTFFDSNGEQLSGEFQFIESESNDNKYLLARMYAPYKGYGLGRACLEFFIDITDAEIFTRPHDGIPRDDGSHLTEDAPAFVGKMQLEGLIVG